MGEQKTKDLGIEMVRVWQELRHEVNVATSSLLYLLKGVAASHLMLIDWIEKPEGMKIHRDTYFPPNIPGIRLCPVFSGEPLIDRLAPGGSADQIAYKGWVNEVWFLWEEKYRPKLKKVVKGTVEGPGIISQRHDVLGDFRHIRNNYLHNSVAKKNEAGACKILRWFNSGERIILELRHVFDFLNQMDWLTEGIVLTGPPENPKTSRWEFSCEPNTNTGGLAETVQPLVSVRGFAIPDAEDWRFRHGVSVVFADGVFGRISLGDPSDSGRASPDKDKQFAQASITDKGDLYLPKFGKCSTLTISSSQLYNVIFSDQRITGPTPWSRPIQFREDTS